MRRRAAETPEAKLERNAARRARWRQRSNTDREHRAAVQRAWRQRADQQSRDRRNATQRRWRAAHPAAVLNNHARSRLRVGAQYLAITERGLADKIAYYGGRCWLCGGPAGSIDHVKPLVLGGAHILANCRPACRGCNYLRGIAPGQGWPLASLPGRAA